MKYLLDTHTFLWAITESPELPDEIIEILEDVENQLYLSMASLWEIAIKLSIGKLRLSFSFDDLPNKLLEANVQVVNVDYEHLRIIERLPLLHRDPFDRLMIAQAMFEDFILLSKDKSLKSYAVQIFWNG